MSMQLPNTSATSNKRQATIFVNASLVLTGEIPLSDLLAGLNVCLAI